MWRWDTRIALSAHFDSVLGIEVHEGAIEVARKNAALNQVKGEWHAGTVETLLHHLEHTEAAHILVDPPRVGLHPKAAEKLAQSVAKSLVYVPAALHRLRGYSILEAVDGASKRVTQSISFHKHHMLKALLCKEAQ